MVKDFPSSPLERAMRKAGAERVSASAVEELMDVMLEMAERISFNAIAVAKHAKRTTVKREDIALVTREDRFKKR
jgi:histone H3/H4